MQISFAQHWMANSTVLCCPCRCPWMNSGKVPRLFWVCWDIQKRPRNSFSSAERRLFPWGSVWTPCGDGLKVWRLLSPPNSGVTQQQPLLKFLGRAAHSRRGVVVWVKCIILTYGSALILNKGRNKWLQKEAENHFIYLTQPVENSFTLNYLQIVKLI